MIGFTKVYKGFRGTVEYCRYCEVYHGKVILPNNDLVTYEAHRKTLLQEEFEKAVDDYLKELNDETNTEGSIPPIQPS